MYNIDSAGNVAGAWSNGAPPLTPGTVLDQTWMNMLQQELENILTAASIAPVKGTNNQVLAAILALIGASRIAYKRDVAPSNEYTTVATFLAGSYASVGICPSSAGEIAESHSDPSGSGSVLYSMVVDATAGCTCNVIVPIYDDNVYLYLDGVLQHTFTGPGNTLTPYGLVLSGGDHVVQFLSANGSGATSCYVNDWMTGNPVTWLRAAHS